MDILGTLQTLWLDSGFAGFFADGGWKNLIMIGVACVLLYLGIVKKFEPLLLVGIAFGCLLTNIPGAGTSWSRMVPAVPLASSFLTSGAGCSAGLASATGAGFCVLAVMSLPRPMTTHISNARPTKTTA